MTGMTISEHDARTRLASPRYEATVIALSYMDREDLYSKINQRVDAMMDKGLLREVKTLLDMGLTREHTSMQAIGYKELAGVLLEGKDPGQAVETVKMESRRYAKRQLSWLRREKNTHWILWAKEPDFDNGLQNSTEYLEKYVYNRAV
jgi:tRNA dimethylallyltransferase